MNFQADLIVQCVRQLSIHLQHSMYGFQLRDAQLTYTVTAVADQLDRHQKSRTQKCVYPGGREKKHLS